MKDYSLINIHLKSYIENWGNLKQVGIIRSKKDFTSQIGEWLVAEMFDGVIAEKHNQIDWDIRTSDGRQIQVKCHAKEKENNNRFTYIKKNPTERVDELIIVVFTEDYKLKEFYQAPWEEAQALIKITGVTKKKEEISWNDLKRFKIPIDKLPKLNLVALFL